MPRLLPKTVSATKTCKTHSFSVAEGHTVVMGAVVTLDEETGRATEIQRVFRPWPPASLG